MPRLDDLRRQLNRKVAVASRNTAAEWESRLRRTSPIDTGSMRNRTTVTARLNPRGSTIEARVDTPYAHIVAAGQRPHVITPRRPGGVLAFDVGGRTVFTRRVNHPGAQPRTWWADAVRDAPDMLARNWHGVR